MSGFVGFDYEICVKMFKDWFHRLLKGARFVMMPLDPLGTIILTLSVVVLFLLVLGLPLVKGINTKKNLKRHGILATFALALQIVFTLVVMLPSFTDNFEAILALSPIYAVNT